MTRLGLQSKFYIGINIAVQKEPIEGVFDRSTSSEGRTKPSCATMRTLVRVGLFKQIQLKRLEHVDGKDIRRQWLTCLKPN